MKRPLLNKIIFILFLLPVHLFAQPSPLADDITGLWKGSLYNDTTKKNLPYEIAISEEKGKLSGYSYTLFDIDGKKELGVKRIKIQRRDDQITIEDIELISNTYSEPPPRKVRQQSVANLLVNDTAMELTGKWSTNRTKEYLPLTGTLQLHRSIDFRPMALFKKLVELKLDQDLSFVKVENKREADIAIKIKPATEIKLPGAIPSQSADADKPNEITFPLADKKEAVAVENKPIKKETNPLEKPVAKSVVEKPAEIIIPVAVKIARVVFVGNESAKKVNKTTGQLIVKAPAIARPKLILPPQAIEKPIELVVRDSGAIKIKIADESVKKTFDKPKTFISPSTEKKKELIVTANDIKKDTNQSFREMAKTIIHPPVTKKTVPVVIAKAPAKKENLISAEIVKNPVIKGKPAIIITPVVNKTAPVTVVKEPVKTESKPTVAIIITPEQKKTLPVEVTVPTGSAAAANVSERKMNKEQSVYFDSDSLVLTLYDNGDVDGDTVSVLMNGQIIFAKQGLSTKANSKTIYMDKAMPDSLSMIMYAENLGSIPPNTGLLIIMDGEKRYEVRFSADLKTNAAILLRRRTKEK